MLMHEQLIHRDEYARIEGTHLMSESELHEKVLDVRNATKLKSLQIFVDGKAIGKTDSTSAEADELRQRINKAIVRGTSKLVGK